VITISIPKLALHHGPSLSFNVWIHVNSPSPQLALKVDDLNGLEGITLLSFQVELILA